MPELVVEPYVGPSRVIMLWLHSAVDPSDGEWAGALECLRAVRARTGFPLDHLSSLIISDGGAPKAHQRVQVAREFPIRSSAITCTLTDPVKRGIAKAVQWTNPHVGFWEPSDFNHALAHICAVDLRLELEGMFAAMGARIAPNASLLEAVRAPRHAAVSWSAITPSWY